MFLHRLASLPPLYSASLYCRVRSPAVVATANVAVRGSATEHTRGKRGLTSSLHALNVESTATVAEADKAADGENDKVAGNAAEGEERPVIKYNDDLANVFYTLAKRTHDKFMIASYKGAASEIERYPRRIESGLMASMVVPGVGKTYAEHIDHFINTGTIPDVKMKKGRNQRRTSKKVEPDGENVVDLLTQIVGMGEKGARKLMEFYNVQSIDDVITKVPANELNRWQFAGVKYFEDFKQMIDRSEMEAWEDKIRDAAEAVDPVIEVDFAGSYRRGAPMSEKIIIHLAHKDVQSKPRDSWKKGGAMLEKIRESLVADGLFVHDVTHTPGQTDYSGVCRLNDTSPHRRIFMHMNPYDLHWYRLFIDTGSGKFIRRLREAADRKGYTLRKDFIEDRRGNYVTHLKSEEELFAFLEEEYLPPSARNA
ncbi:hypothetical protein HDU88_007309 [Geranomyces variabilis]|nr:hypothetical protein HDU88_007309 [Geranomyces variabilis]